MSKRRKRRKRRAPLYQNKFPCWKDSVLRQSVFSLIQDWREKEEYTLKEVEVMQYCLQYARKHDLEIPAEELGRLEQKCQSIRGSMTNSNILYFDLDHILSDRISLAKYIDDCHGRNTNQCIGAVDRYRKPPAKIIELAIPQKETSL